MKLTAHDSAWQERPCCKYDLVEKKTNECRCEDCSVDINHWVYVINGCLFVLLAFFVKKKQNKNKQNSLVMTIEHLITRGRLSFFLFSFFFSNRRQNWLMKLKEQGKFWKTKDSKTTNESTLWTRALSVLLKWLKTPRGRWKRPPGNWPWRKYVYM